MRHESSEIIKRPPAIAIRSFDQTRIRFQIRPSRVTLTGSPLISTRSFSTISEKL